MTEVDTAYARLRRRSGELLSVLGILKGEAHACASLDRPAERPADAQVTAIAVAISETTRAADALHEAIRDAERAARSG